MLPDWPSGLSEVRPRGHFAFACHTVGKNKTTMRDIASLLKFSGLRAHRFLVRMLPAMRSDATFEANANAAFDINRNSNPMLFEIF